MGGRWSHRLQATLQILLFPTRGIEQIAGPEPPCVSIKHRLEAEVLGQRAWALALLTDPANPVIDTATAGKHQQQTKPISVLDRERAQEPAKGREDQSSSGSRGNRPGLRRWA